MNIIGHKKIFLSISGLIVLVAIGFIVVFGFVQGVDFKGGTLWQFQISENTPEVASLEEFFGQNTAVGEAQLNYDESNNSFLLRVREIGEDEHQVIFSTLLTEYPSFQELSFQSIGPSVGEKLRKNAVVAVLLSLLAVSLYIAFVFRKTSRPVSSWKYGVVTLVTLFHDIIIPTGVLAILGKYTGLEVDSNFIVALLVIMGFSVHDTIVVFDRIRENLSFDQGKSDFGQVINSSINQTIARSVNTSFTLILVLIALYFVGPINPKFFILTLIIGTSVGVYSSIFVASPLLLVWHQLKRPK